MFGNIVFGFCIWDIAAALVLGAVAVAVFVQQKQHKERMKSFPGRIEE